MPSSKSAYPAYDQARTAFNRHLRARRDIIQARYDQHFDAIKDIHQRRFEEANAALLLSSNAKMPKGDSARTGLDAINEFRDANNGVICSENMADAWKAAKVQVVIGIDSDSRQFGTARVTAELANRPAYDVSFDIRGDPVKDNEIMFGDDVDDHLRHGLARVVIGDSLQAMRLGRDDPQRWLVPEEHLHPKVGYLWLVLHHPLDAHRIHTAVEMLRNSHRRGSPDSLLGLSVAELLTPRTITLHATMGQEHHDMVTRDSAMLHPEWEDDGVKWRPNTPWRFTRGKADRGPRIRTWSQITVQAEIPETLAVGLAGTRLGDLVALPSCGDARTDDAVADAIVSRVSNDGRGGAVLTLEPTQHIPLVTPPDALARLVEAFAPSS